MTERNADQPGTMLLSERAAFLLDTLANKIAETGDHDLIQKWRELGVNVIGRSDGYTIASVGSKPSRSRSVKGVLASHFRSHRSVLQKSTRVGGPIRLAKARGYGMDEERKIAGLITEFEKALESTDQNLETGIVAARDLYEKVGKLNEDLRAALDRGRKALAE